jgi:hypothetical protein
VTQVRELRAKLPSGAVSIFEVMSRLAGEVGAINLSQGFPDFDCAPELVEAVARQMRAGHNQYAPMPGVMALRQALAGKIERLYGRRYDPVTELTVTTGATEGIFIALTALVHPGDEVLLFQPAYDSYTPSVVLSGGRPRYVTCPICPSNAAIDAVLRMTPRSPFSSGSFRLIRSAARRAMLNVETRLRSMTRRKSSSGCGPFRLRVRMMIPPPAVLQTKWSAPSSSQAADNATSVPSKSVTSQA